MDSGSVVCVAGGQCSDASYLTTKVIFPLFNIYSVVIFIEIK